MPRPMRNILTDAQQKVYEYINDYISKHGRSPSYKEIAGYMEYSSRASAFQAVQSLLRKKYLYKDSHGMIRPTDTIEGIKTKEFTNARFVPIVSSVKEGESIIRQDVVKEYFPITNKFFADYSLFLYKADRQDDELNIKTGDYLICTVDFDPSINEPGYKIIGNDLVYVKQEDFSAMLPDGSILGEIRFLEQGKLYSKFFCFIL